MLTREQVDSDEEFYMIWYLEELLVHGIILSYEYHPQAFELAKPMYTYSIETKVLKTKTKTETKLHEVLKAHVYTPDFKIIWNPSAQIDKFVIRYDEKLIRGQKGVFQAKQFGNELITYIDVKSGAISPYMNSSAVSFAINQKWTYKEYGIFVQKIIPIYNKKVKMKMTSTGLFVTTFTPERYLMSDGNTQRRKLHYDPKRFIQYYNE